MKKILIVGLNPHTIDFSMPGYPAGLTAEKVLNGLEAERKNLRGMGLEAELHLIDVGAPDVSPLAELLKSIKFDGIVIGAGVRVPPSNFLLFEKLINTVHEHAPASKIIFNTNPLDTAESVKRWL